MIKISDQECYQYYKQSLEIYEETKHLRVFSIIKTRAVAIREALLKYRRENNIFEVGDKIECIDATGQRYLKLGAVYTVGTPDGHKIFVDGYRRYSFLTSRFRHVGGKS